MTEIIVGFLAISGAVFWLLALVPDSGVTFRRVKRVEQRAVLDLSNPSNWTCTDYRCKYRGAVLFFAGYQPVCPECGEEMVPVAPQGVCLK